MKVMFKNDELVFDDIRSGTVFTWGEHAYIKLSEPCIDGSGKSNNAVALESGELNRFESCCVVTAYPDAVLTI